MEFDKDTIVNFLKSQGRHEDAQRADAQLPQTVDHERDAGMLSGLGINPQELLTKLPGGLGDKIGGLFGDK